MPSSRIADQVGRVLGGRYRLLAPVGTGASAHVFVADDVVLRRRVAVKVLQSGLADDEGFLRRFRTEARAAAGLNHPNIMRVFDWGEDDDGPFLVLEFLGGGSLRDMLDQGDRLSPAQAALVGVEAARALDYAHRRGIVHRDIKPANLLFDDESRLCVADFGLARALAEAASTEPQGALVGTVRYASPEQARGASVDGKGDVYALGLVLIEAVTGRVPFSADTTIGTLMGRVEQPVPVPDELGPLAPVLTRAGTVSPDERIDAAELAGALSEVAAGLPAPGRFPLAGIVPLDASRTVDADPTQMPPLRPRLFDREQAGNDVGGADGDEEAVPWVLTPSRKARRRRLRLPHRQSRVRAERERGRRWPIVVLAVILAALLAGGGVAVATGMLVASHPVPQLRNDTLAQARATVAADKFKVVVAHHAFDETVVKGLVISTDPPANAKLKEHRTLGLTISDGPKPRAVPDLTNFTEAQAKAKLVSLGLAEGTVTGVYSETVKAGVVMAWDPKTGIQVPKGGAVSLTVSKGPQPRTIANFQGQDPGAAQAALQAQGLVVAITQVFDNNTPPGKVASTTPAAGTPVPRGSTVTINVSKGPQLVPVPDVRGMSVSDARNALVAAGFVVNGVDGDPSKPVTNTSPPAGTPSKPGTSVNLHTH